MTALDSKKIERINLMIQTIADAREIDITGIHENEIDGLIDEALNLAGIKVSVDDHLKIRKDLEYSYNITQKEGVGIVDDYEHTRDWYSARCEKNGLNDEYFWKRFKNYLILDEKLNINVVNKLGNDTLVDLINYLGDPNDTATFFRRGLVIGDVQSGKTSTYTGLICKAADSGYKIVILLTGVTETLRSQTQERMEEGIIGISITGLKNKFQGKTITRVGIGKDGKPIKVTAMTSVEYDFIGSMDQITTSLESHKLVMFIVKKNTKVLNKLHDWLKEMNIDSADNKIHYPMLLIDDEADNASINTNKEEEDPTKTNEVIRRLAHLFTQTSYVGFTATPYANVFINPDTPEEMLNDDLFPKNFIYVLEAPSNYIGASQIFSGEGKYKNSIQWIQDIEEPDESSDEKIFDTENKFYYKHKKEWDGELPDSLLKALHCFFLANVIRDLRGDFSEPRTMMINISRFVKVQKHIKNEIAAVFNDIYNEIRTNFSNNQDKNSKLKLYRELMQCWEECYPNCDVKWADVSKRDNLLRAIESIEVLVVNSGKESGRLDYKKNPSLRAVAIGGLALSRGLTLKGLMVSYFYRNTASFDVLMQMGRWFGYRKNYDDLFRIWTSQRSANWYNEIVEATNELKYDISRMRDAKLTPEDFGLRVRNESEELKITAPNKMRHAQNHIEQVSFWGAVFDTPYLDIDIEKNNKNQETTVRFINQLVNAGYGFNREESAKDLYFCRNIPYSMILHFLKGVSISAHNSRFDTKQITEFMRTCDDPALDKWDIVLIEGDRNVDDGKAIKIDSNISVTPVQRGYEMTNNRVAIGGKRARLTSPTDARNGLSMDQIAKARCMALSDGAKGITLPRETWFKYIEDRNPLLMIYFIRLDMKGAPLNEVKFLQALKNESAMGFSIGFPKSNKSHSAQFIRYKVNMTYNRQEIENIMLESQEE